MCLCHVPSFALLTSAGRYCDQSCLLWVCSLVRIRSPATAADGRGGRWAPGGVGVLRVLFTAWFGKDQFCSLWSVACFFSAFVFVSRPITSSFVDCESIFLQPCRSPLLVPGIVPVIWIGDFRPLVLRISETVQYRTKDALLLITNRKSHTRFRLVPKSTTLDDPELTLNGHYALCYITHVFGGHR